MRPLFLATLVLGYAVGLLWHIGHDPQGGVHCLLRGGGEGRPRMVVDSSLEFVGDKPVSGAQILAVGGETIPTFIHFNRRLSEISAQPQSAQIEQPGATPDPTQGLAAIVDQGPTRWVRIDFQTDDGPPQATWVRLKPASAGAMLVSGAWFALELLVFGIGALVVWRRPGDISAALFYVLCAVQVVMFLGAFHWPNLVDTRLLMYPFLACSVLLAPLMLHFHLLFPRPSSLLRRWPRWTLRILYAIPAVWLVLMFGSLVRMTWLYDSSASAGQINWQLRAFSVLMYVYLVVSLTMFLTSQGLLVRNFLRARTAAERNQVKWLLASIFVAVGPVGYLLYTSTWQPAEFIFGVWSKAMMYATSAVFAIGYALSITRYKLMQASRLIDRGLLYVAISFAATLLFCAMVGLGTMLVGRYYFSWENAAAAGLTAMLVVVLLGLLRDRFQRALDRRFHQQKYQLDKAMLRLGEAVDQLIEPAQLARQLLQSARDAVRSDRGAVYLRDAAAQHYDLAAWTGWPAMPVQMRADNPLIAELARSAMVGCEPSHLSAPLPALRELRVLDVTLALSLELDGEAVGLMALGPKQDATSYTAEDRAFLLALVQTTALALRSARGHKTIESLRQELSSKVDKIAEQQQRIHFLQTELLNRPVPSKAASPPPPATRPRKTAPPVERLGPREIHGSSLALTSLMSEAAKVARSNSSVLIRGESGTGKELLAQAIHEQSLRAGGPFVPVHCAALSAGLLESELFGHVRGAFTGAERDKPGRFELADQGTLFLDEIGDINLETQTKLLRVLQQRTFERVGGSRTIQVDVRLITATHQDLEALIRAGRFREDLYYRLNVISLRCPALRERREDVYELALCFLRRYAAEAGKVLTGIEDEVLEALKAYSWPGNIRQLENAIQRAVVLADGDSLCHRDLPPEILAADDSPIPTAPQRFRPARGKRGADTSRNSSRIAVSVLDQELEGLERQRIVDAIAQAAGNKAAAARLLGLPRSTFFSKLRKHGLDS